MVKERLQKAVKKSFGSILFWAVCILLVFAALTLWGVSYAKYVSGGDNGDSSKVAYLGVEVFELKEHKATTDDVSEMVNKNVLHILDMDTEVSGSGESSYIVPPGVDIPKDPFIRLTINSEVSYELYVKVTCKQFAPSDSNGNSEELVVYYLADNWELDQSDEENGVYTYRYIVDSNATDAAKFTFIAGESYNYNNGNEISILKNDMLYVSQKYYAPDEGTKESLDKKESLTFSIKFEAYIQQVIFQA